MKKIVSSKLEQTINREILDPKNNLTNDDWIEFLGQYEATFETEISRFARELFREYLINYKGRVMP